MNVKLVSLTKSAIEEKELNAEELIVYIARVSNPANQLNSETSDKLISYLIKNKHWSPFEMVDMTVSIVTSRGIAQQILRHRSFSFQEFSQRYAEVTEMESIQLRKAGTTNRQSSSEEFDPALDHLKLDVLLENCGSNMPASYYVKRYIEAGETLYRELINQGIAKESARFILPITTQTKIYMKGSVRSWIHYLQIRLDQHTQVEHGQVAEAILPIFFANFPNLSRALNLSILK